MGSVHIDLQRVRKGETVKAAIIVFNAELHIKQYSELTTNSIVVVGI